MENVKYISLPKLGKEKKKYLDYVPLWMMKQKKLFIDHEQNFAYYST